MFYSKCIVTAHVKGFVISAEMDLVIINSLFLSVEGNVQGRRRSAKWRESRPKNDTAPQRRQPQQQSQKFRPTDKRPRTRGYYSDSPKQEVSNVGIPGISLIIFVSHLTLGLC